MYQRTSVLALLLTALFSAAQGNQGTPLSESVLASFGSPDDVIMGDPIFLVPPKYPKEALAAKVQGTVVLRLSINKDGKVKSVTALSGDSRLSDAAINAVKKWQYAPYFVNEKRVEVQTVIAITFKQDGMAVPVITASYRVPEKPKLEETFKPGHGVTPPKPIYTPDPNYSEEARKNKQEGTCVIGLVVGGDGRPYYIHVERALGFGLDERAIASVKGWRFQPGTKDGKPVAVTARVEIAFHLY